MPVVCPWRCYLVCSCTVNLAAAAARFCSRICKRFAVLARNNVKSGHLYLVVFGAGRRRQVRGLDDCMNAFRSFGRRHCRQRRLLESQVADRLAEALGVVHALENCAADANGGRGWIGVEGESDLCLKVVQ